MKKSPTRFLINSGTYKRTLYFYLPFFILLYLFLFAAAEITKKEDQFLEDTIFISDQQIPIVYNPYYNIEFFGLEEFHHFDSKKYGRIFDYLREQGFKTENFIEAKKPDLNTLLTHHTSEYIDSLNSSWKLAQITELGFLRFFPTQLSRNVVLEPMLYQSGGSIQAAVAALEHRAAINLGGGFHHASADNGEGFCAISDIGLIIRYLRNKNLASRFMILDLDAHQGNGHQADFNDDPDVFIFDVYNKDVYPHADHLKSGIDQKIELSSFSGDQVFLTHVKNTLPKAIKDFKPDLIIYVAGTDILAGDPLGALSLSKHGIIERDQIVFMHALARDAPVVMLLAGGYQKSNADIIAQSIINLDKKFSLFSKK